MEQELFMSDSKVRFAIWLEPAKRNFSKWMAYKYPCRDSAVAVRTAIQMMAVSLGYDLENDKPPDVPPAHRKGLG